MHNRKISKPSFPAVSIIVPVYNVEKYLERCLNSLILQTLQSIEIICIDDASTDNSGNILDRYARKDTRIKAIHLKQNTGTLCARLKGMEAASGEFLIFVDSDDALEPNACAELSDLMASQKTDLVHFGTILHAGENVSDEMLSWVADFLKPLDGRLEGNLNQDCFVSECFDFNITNKIWKSEVVRQALPYVQRRKLTASEDRYFAFLLLYFAHSYYGVQHPYYHYYLGIGITGGDTLSLEQFEKRCTGAAAPQLVMRFLTQMGEDGRACQESAEQFGKKILWDCVDGWYHKLQPADKQRGFGILCQYFQPDQLVSAIARVYFEQETDIYAGIQMEHGKRAAVYDRYLDWEETADGPVRQCIDDLQQLGYEVFLYTDEERRQESFDLYRNVCGVRVFYLPDSREANWDRYEMRAEQLYARIKIDRIQRLLYVSPSSHIAWLDMLLVRLAGVDAVKLRDKEQSDQTQRWKREYEKLETEYRSLSVQFDSPKMMLQGLFVSCRRRLGVARHRLGLARHRLDIFRHK